MLVPFSLAPDALAQNDIPLHRKEADQKRFLEIWRAHGVLDMPENEVPMLQKIVTDLPQKLRKGWNAALASPGEFPLRKFAAREGWPTFDGVESLEHLDLLSPRVRLVAVSDDDYQLLDCGDDCSMKRGALEICSYCCVDTTQTLDELRELARTPIEKGDSVDKTWNARFAPLTRVSRTVIVVDRYASSTLPALDEPLAKLAEYLDRDGQNLTLKLYAAEPDDFRRYQRRLEKIANSLTGGIHQWHVYWAKDSLFRDGAHDRYIRFGERVCTLGSGIEFLRDTDVRRRCEFSCRWSNAQDDGFQQKAHAMSMQTRTFWKLRR